MGLFLFGGVAKRRKRKQKQSGVKRKTRQNINKKKGILVKCRLGIGPNEPTGRKGSNRREEEQCCRVHQYLERGGRGGRFDSQRWSHTYIKRDAKLRLVGETRK